MVQSFQVKTSWMWSSIHFDQAVVLERGESSIRVMTHTAFLTVMAHSRLDSFLTAGSLLRMAHLCSHNVRCPNRSQWLERRDLQKEVDILPETHNPHRSWYTGELSSFISHFNGSMHGICNLADVHCLGCRFRRPAIRPSRSPEQVEHSSRYCRCTWGMFVHILTTSLRQLKEFGDLCW